MMSGVLLEQDRRGNAQECSSPVSLFLFLLLFFLTLSSVVAHGLALSIRMHNSMWICEVIVRIVNLLSSAMHNNQRARFCGVLHVEVVNSLLRMDQTNCG